MSEVTMPITQHKLQLAEALAATLQPTIEAAVEVALAGVVKARRFAGHHGRADWAALVEAPTARLIARLEALDPGFAQALLAEAAAVLEAERAARAPAQEPPPSGTPPTTAEQGLREAAAFEPPEGTDSEGGRGDAKR